jgi:hypothetical protein
MIYFCQKLGALHPVAKATIKALTCFDSNTDPGMGLMSMGWKKGG